MQRITAAAVPLILTDGTHLRFSPLTDKDTEEIDEWISARIINTARNSFTASMSQVERNEILDVAIRQAAKTTITTHEGLVMLTTIPGMAFVCWLSLRKEHPTFTVEKVQDLLTQPGNLDRFNSVLYNTNGLGEQESKKVKRVRVKKKRR